MPQSSDILETLVDEQVGIIDEVRERRKMPGTADFVYMSARTCNLDRVKVMKDRERVFIGSGVSTDRYTATLKAVGEAIERYCAAHYAVDDLPFVSFDAATFPCVEPESFALFSEKQYAAKRFPYKPFNRRVPIRWVPALDLASRKKQYVPAAMVFLPYDQIRMGEVPITQQISTGLACHSNPFLATLTAVCEVIERDAIAVTWQAKLTRQLIRLTSVSDESRDLLARLSRPEATIRLLYLRMDHGVPVIFAVMTNTVIEAPALVAAAAAHPDPERAVRKSLEELAQIATLSQWMKSQRAKFNPGKHWENVVDPDSHAATYFQHENTHLAEFLWSSGNEIAFSEIENIATGEPEADLRCVIDRIEAVQHQVLAADVTTDDVRALGFWVIRAIIPGFHPLFMGYKVRALGGTRLRTVPEKLGYRTVGDKRQDNDAPHPFA